VRGFFGDPRIGAQGGTSFHFGIDVSVPDGTPVYSVIAGTVHLNVAGGPQNIAVTSPGVTHGYWHVVPAVADGQHVGQGGLPGRPDRGTRPPRRPPPGAPVPHPGARGCAAPLHKAAPADGRPHPCRKQRSSARSERAHRDRRSDRRGT